MIKSNHIITVWCWLIGVATRAARAPMPLATDLRNTIRNNHANDINHGQFSSMGMGHCSNPAADPSETQCFPLPPLPELVHCIASAQALAVCTEMVSATSNISK